MHPLNGITVIDLTMGVSGPMCTRLLGDWGARVIKVEPPGVGDFARDWDTVCHGISSTVVWSGRNKESLALNLKHAAGGDVLGRLLARADVLVENFTPGSLARLGLDSDTLRTAYPRLVVCHISGYGQDGPYAQMRAFDMLMQGEAGLLAMNGTPEEMSKIPLSVCDIGVGMYAAAGICAALRGREQTGVGTELEVSMFESMLDWLSYFPHFYWHRGQLPARLGTRHHLLTPYGPYAASDGKVINIAVLSHPHWQRFCKLVGHPEWDADPRFATNEARMAHRQELEEAVAVALATRTRDKWLEILGSAGIPCGRVNTLDEVVAHPQVQARHFIREVPTSRGPVPTFDNPVRWRGLETPMGPVPDLGADTQRILSEIGLDEDAVCALRASGVVA